MVAMVLREGMTLAVVGTAIGVAVAIAIGRGMTALLFGIPPTDARTIAASVALCFITAVAGCLRPAIRAARVDPVIALREE
jgi:putative ABC transport system permease protein